MNRDQALAVRSIMFVPALADAYIEKAHTRGADAIIVDLEDSIPPELKDKARGAVGRAVATLARHLPVFVRVNNQSDLLDLELEAAVGEGLAGILLPKAERATQVRDVAEKIAQLAKAKGPKEVPALALLVETPLGVHMVAELALEPAVVALVFGSEDYSAILGVRPTAEAMSVPAQNLTIAARAHGLAAWGVAGTIVDIADVDLLTRVATNARQIGFTGSIAINPKQIPIFNAAFGISEQEIAWAKETITVFDSAVKEGRAAVAHKGKMIDTPVALRAKLLLDRARRYSGAATAQ